MVEALNISNNVQESHLKLLILSDMLYELQSPTMFSGVLAAESNGTVMHGRNMDYSFPFVMSDGRRLDLLLSR